MAIARGDTACLISDIVSKSKGNTYATRGTKVIVNDIRGDVAIVQTIISKIHFPCNVDQIFKI